MPSAGATPVSGPPAMITRQQQQRRDHPHGIACSQRLRPAHLAVARAEVDLEAATTGFVPVFAPTDALFPLGAAHTLVLPVHRKGLNTEGPLGPALPTHVFAERAHKVDPVSLARADELFGAHVAGVDQVYA